jgi:hypothetical protein
VYRSDLGPPLLSVRGPNELKDARRIDGIDPRLAFAIRHDDLSRHCREESPGDWLLVVRVDLPRERVKAIRRVVVGPP